MHIVRQDPRSPRNKSETSIITCIGGEMLVKKARDPGKQGSVLCGGAMRCLSVGARKEREAEDKGAKQNIDIRQVENAGVQTADRDDHKVGDAAVVVDSVQEVAEAAAGRQGQGNVVAGVAAAREQEVGQAADQEQCDTYIEEKELQVRRQTADNAEETFMVFDQGKLYQAAEEGDFTGICEEPACRHFGKLVGGDGEKQEADRQP